MIIECPECHTRYRAENLREITETTLFECSRNYCGHVFSLTPDLLQTATPPPEKETPEEFSLDPAPPEIAPTNSPSVEHHPPIPPLLQEEEPPLMSSDSPPETPAALTSPPPAPKKAKEQENIFEDFDDPEESIPFSVSVPPSPSHEKFIFTAEEGGKEDMTSRRRASSRPRPSQAAITMISPWPVLGFLLFLVLGYHTLGQYSQAYVTETEALLARLPLIGSAFVESQFSVQHISLSNLKSGFWITKDNKRVFAVSGKATNNAPVPASTIQIEGQLHDLGGKTVGQQTIFCGMGATADNLSTMTTNEIEVLQNLIPPKQFHVPPKESVDFLIVFANPPQTVTELSCRVTHVQFSRS